jgi:hypothetical protein
MSVLALGRLAGGWPLAVWPFWPAKMAKIFNKILPAKMAKFLIKFEISKLLILLI